MENSKYITFIIGYYKTIEQNSISSLPVGAFCPKTGSPMVSFKPFRTRLLLLTAWCVALMMPTGLFIAAADGQKPVETVSLSAASAPRFFDTAEPGKILNHKDTALYKALFRAEHNADWAAADATIAQINDPLLVGHALAQRYMNRHYNSTREQLADWLTHYADLPQAANIYGLAMSRYPALKDQVSTIAKQPALAAYGDDSVAVSLGGDMPYANTWRAAINAWRLGHKEEAAKLFSGLTQHSDELSSWNQAAAAYWAWRAYDALGDHDKAQEYLETAATQPRSFYGILARRQLHEPLNLDNSPADLSDTDRDAMNDSANVRRAIALSQIGQDELAEQELRIRFLQADNEEKSRLLALAHELKLPTLQISMARQLRDADHQLDFARYPIPNWQPEGGFKVSPALIFALMRQESGFHATAVSPGGALGLMQLMPQTASLMQKSMNKTLGIVTEPTVNMMLGQHYVQNLLDNNLVSGNLVYLLAAYNAGPAHLQEWKENAALKNDPLLFIESIPYAQTRNYVMQVMTNYWIYSELTGEADNSVASLMQGKFPSYAQVANNEE